jgi:hypothetical protein
MPKTSIGQLNVQLTAEANEFDKVLDASKSKLNAFGKDASKPLGGAGGLLGKVAGMTGMGGGIGDLAGAAAGGPAGMVTAGAKVAAEAVHALWQEAKNLGEEWLTVSKRADMYGISTNAMTGLTIAAKDRAEEMQIALLHLQRNIGEAAIGSAEAQGKFERLGVSWRELQNVPLDVAFGMVNDAIMKTNSSAKQGVAAFQEYGRSGQLNMALIKQGSAGIDKGIATAITKGLAPDPQFMAKYKEYKTVSRELDQSLEGAKNKIVSTLSMPLMDGAIWMKKIATSWTDDLFHSKVASPGQIKAARMKEMQAAKEKAAAEATAEASVKKATEEKQALESAKSGAKQLGEQLAAADMIGTAAEVARKRYEASRTSNAETKALLQQQAQILLQIGDKQSAAKLRQETLTPLEKANEKYEEMNRLFQRGLIDSNLFARGVGNLAEELERAAGASKELALPKPLIRGTQEERSFFLKLDREQQQRSGEDPVKKFVDAVGLLKDKQAATATSAQAILDFLRAQGSGTPVNFN